MTLLRPRTAVLSGRRKKKKTNHFFFVPVLLPRNKRHGLDLAASEIKRVWPVWKRLQHIPCIVTVCSMPNPAGVSNRVKQPLRKRRKKKPQGKTAAIAMEIMHGLAC
jgi:hypothetical protein